MNLIDKYIPTTQKSLFHKDICTHIRKWTTNLIESDSLDKKKILFLFGPVGCGKTASVNILLKPFNIIDIDSNDLRQEKTSDIMSSIVGFNDITLNNIEKWNHANKKDKPNVVLVDNIELCDKNIVSFVENIHGKNNINVPIVLICNNQKYKNIFSSYKNCTYIEFNKPSLLELTKLISDINTSEKLNLNKENIKTIIEKSEFDVRQTFYLLDQWKIRPFKFNEFIESMDKKHADIDLTDKLIYLTDNTKLYDMSDTFTLSTSEPISLSNGIFQNYCNIVDYYDSKESQESQENDKLNVENIDTCVEILDNISHSNIFYKHIVEDQYWELYESYSMSSCVIPSYYIKHYNKRKKVDNKENTVMTNEKELYYRMNSFKDVSYNYLNSFNEVKSIASDNIFSKKFNTSIDTENTENSKYGSYNIIRQDISFYFEFIQLCISQIKIINENFDKNKKGKNTTKSEKILLCKSIDGNAEKALDFMVNNIYSYKLFEIQIDDLLLNKNKYLTKDENEEISLSKTKTKSKKTIKLNINENEIVDKENESNESKKIKKTKNKNKQPEEIKQKIETINENTSFNDIQIINDIDKIDIRLFKRLLNIFSFYESSKILKSHVEIAIKYKIFYLLLNDIKLQKESIKKTRIESLVQDLEEIWNFSK